MVSEARPSGAGAEDEEDEVVGEMGEGEDEDDDEVNKQGEGVEQQVGELGQAPQAPRPDLNKSKNYLKPIF